MNAKKKIKLKTSQIKIVGLPKLSLNEWYSGNHWSRRHKIKKNFQSILKKQVFFEFPKHFSYEVDYTFFFLNRPLDATNCVAMVKIIEDLIFEDDSYKIIKKISIASRKSKEEYVLMEIKIMN